MVTERPRLPVQAVHAHAGAICTRPPRAGGTPRTALRVCGQPATTGGDRAAHPIRKIKKQHPMQQRRGVLSRARHANRIKVRLERLERLQWLSAQTR